MVPAEAAEEAVAISQTYRQIQDRPLDEPHVFRMLDVGAGVGLFAAFAAIRWQYAWIDAYESRTAFSSVLRLNAQPGTRFFDEVPRPIPPCDALHVGAHVHDLEFNGDQLKDLKVVVWEFATDEQFENSAGFLRAIGLKLAHVAMVDRGPPVRGWQMWIRRK